MKRYKEVLAIFQTGKNVAKSFQKYGVDSLTIVKTADIAELAMLLQRNFSRWTKGVQWQNFSKGARRS